MNLPSMPEQRVKTAAAMEALGMRLATRLHAGLLLFLHGELGAGKTTLIRGVLHGLGHTGAVKSPTYTLVEPYSLPGFPVYHFDLYRMNNPEELEFIGMRDYLAGQGVCLVEWAERGAAALPAPDVDVTIERAGDARVVRFSARTDKGSRLMHGFA